MLAGSFPVVDVTDRFSEAVPPGGTTPDDRTKESDWQKAVGRDHRVMASMPANLNVRRNIGASS